MSISVLKNPQRAVVERALPIASIRQDGNTQHRDATNLAIVAEYAELMQAGERFPPVTVWWDSNDYWLTDGFHRLAAASQAGILTVQAEIWQGTLEEAQWHSYSLNTRHGVRRTPTETERVIALAIGHPNATDLSNVKLAEHLHLPESTVRRWRAKLLPEEINHTRRVTRGITSYSLQTKNIGKSKQQAHLKTRDELRKDIADMKGAASPNARRILVVLGNWMFSSAHAVECLKAIESIVTKS